jgi:UDP-2,3-diacylglucosamine pyrophosphatase LpxH
MGLGGVWKRVRGTLRERPHNLLAISDLHLGCDLKPGAKPARGGFDTQLAGFLDHHGSNRKNGKPWRLILDGDIVDFVAITVTPGPGDAGFEITDEERQFGLGSEEAKCVWKLRQTFARHPAVFDALARFLQKGNFLHIVRGNHDAEFHWTAVQQEFKTQLAARLALTGNAQRRFELRIQFHQWFYLEPGFFYAEHGNAHDRYSVQSGFFDPAGVSHALELPLSSKVLRYFANRYAEQTDLDEVDTWGVPEYIDWVLKAGNPLRIAADYFVMVWRVTYPVFVQSLKVWRRFARAADKAISQVDAHASSAHVRRALGRFSGTEAQARQLLAIASRPAEESLFDSMQLFYLDRAVLAVLGLLGAVAAVGAAHGLWAKIGAAVATGIGFAALNAVLAGLRRTDSHPMLQQAARRIAQLFDVKYVVMGHSHRVVDESIGSGARYLNLGSWTNSRIGFPHAVVEEGVAELRYWKNGAAAAEAREEQPSPQPAPLPIPA